MVEPADFVNAFLRAAHAHADRPALLVGDRELPYGRLAERAAGWADTLNQYAPHDTHLVGLFAYRSETAYTGLLAIHLSGRGYLPLNPRLPADRVLRTLELSGTRMLIAGKEVEAALVPLLEVVRESLVVLLPDAGSSDSWRVRFPRHHFIDASQISSRAGIPGGLELDPANLAYLLFTSGSTGEPKGVPVRHSNLSAYVRTVVERHGVTERDRFSQLPDLTFDLSIQDLFPCWASGAALHVVPQTAMFSPARFIRKHRITMWTSVPSVISFLDQMQLLAESAFPSIRWSVFCGEPLTAAQAQAWQRAATNSRVDNLYGPTEATCAISGYIWDADTSPGQSRNGVVPIGFPFPGQQCRIVDDRGLEVGVEVAGELCLSGSQVTTGYFNDPARSAERYVHLDGSSALWYRTGDLVARDVSGCMYFVGRADHQVKILGYRVELHEIDGAVRRAAGVDDAVSVAWPVREGSAEGIVTFVSGAPASTTEAILNECRKWLPHYAVPKRLCFVTQFPLNNNGKIDRHKLLEILRKETA